MKLQNLIINETPLSIAIKKENLEIIHALIANSKVDINLPYIFIIFL